MAACLGDGALSAPAHAGTRGGCEHAGLGRVPGSRVEPMLGHGTSVVEWRGAWLDRPPGPVPRSRLARSAVGSAAADRGGLRRQMPRQGTNFDATIAQTLRWLLVALRLLVKAAAAGFA